MESIWALSPPTAERLYAIAIAAICLGAVLTVASLIALLSAIASQSKILKLQLALAEARTREAEASIAAARAEQDRLKPPALLETPAPPPSSAAVSPAPSAPEKRVLSEAQKSTLARRLGDQLPAMQFKLAVAAADDSEAQALGLQLMQFFEDEGVALVAQRNPRAPYASRHDRVPGASMLVKYKSAAAPPFAENLRDSLADAGIAAELRQDASLNLEEIQLVVLRV